MGKNDFLRHRAAAPPAQAPQFTFWKLGSWTFVIGGALQGLIIGFQIVEVDDPPMSCPECGAELSAAAGALPRLGTKRWRAVTLLTINSMRIELDEEDSTEFLTQIAPVLGEQLVDLASPEALTGLPPGGFPGLG